MRTPSAAVSGVVLLFLVCNSGPLVNSFTTPIPVPVETKAEFELVSVGSLSERSLDGRREIHIRAFGQDHHLTLREAEHNIFADDFQHYSVETGADGQPVLVAYPDNDENKNVLGNGGQLYSVEGSTGTLYLDETDGLKVEGIINDDLRIAPHPESEGEADHVVTRIPATSADLLANDMIQVNESIGYHTPLNLDPRQQAPQMVVVEVLVFLDHLNVKALDSDDSKIKKYIGIFWSSVARRYYSASNPTVKIVLSGLISAKNANAQPFIESNRHDDTHVNGLSTLTSFRQWLDRNKNTIKNYDAVVLQMGVDGGSTEGGRWEDSMAGLAYSDTACKSAGFNSAFAEDKAPSFDGMLVATHELGHILGLPHDGTEGATSCPNTGSNGGYIMATHVGGANQWKFSSCSLNILRTFTKDSARKCLWNPSGGNVPLVNEWPAAMLSLDQQCKLNYDSRYVFYGSANQDTCQKLTCQIPGSNSYSWSGGAVEGSSCGYRKYCAEGQCRSY